MSDRPSLLINQAAAHAGVRRRTMYYWIAAGKVQHFKTLNGSTRVWLDSIPTREARHAARVERGHELRRLHRPSQVAP